jgi:hypothetical protein
LESRRHNLHVIWIAAELLGAPPQIGGRRPGRFDVLLDREHDFRDGRGEVFAGL